jgi:hypothetical protein
MVSIDQKVILSCLKTIRGGGGGLLGQNKPLNLAHHCYSASFVISARSTLMLGHRGQAPVSSCTNIHIFKWNALDLQQHPLFHLDMTLLAFSWFLDR